ncbi:MAG TPA: serine/threonine-protein kinase [Kofleriaceae bacterium]
MQDEDDRKTEAMAVPPVHEPSGELIDVRIGTAIGEYVVDGELGHGGMGVVYSATHPLIGKRAAIKVLKSSSNPAAVERFVQEARAVNQIGHPNIVDIFDFAQLPDGRRYLVMDLLVGESLRARVKRGPLPVAEACAVLDEIASALAAAHGKGFAHRDLKPDNVFLSTGGGRLDVKLLDFGLAKLLPTSALTSDRMFRTATGVQLGTPDYMSPEQLRAEPDVDHRTDIFALGVVAFEILTGTRPRRLGNDRWDLPGTPGQMVAAVGGVPPELAQLVETMLSPDPDGRPSIVATRTVLKRLRPILAVAASSPALAHGSLPPVHELTPSLVGAKPVLPTPPRGSKRISTTPPLSSPLDGPSPLGKTKLGVAPARISIDGPRVVSGNLPVAAPAPAKPSRVGLIVAIVVFAAVAGVAIVLALS